MDRSLAPRHLFHALVATLLVTLVAAVPPAAGAVRATTTTTGAAGGASEARQQGASSAIDWKSCGGDHAAFDCATVVVPLDYDRPRGATTSIAVARHPAQGSRLGTVFVNPGGPGGSGVQMVLGGFGPALGEALDGRFDVVGFDPRGVAASDPIHCFDSEEQLGAFFADLPAFPYLKEQRRPFFERMTSLWPQCRSQREAMLRHMSTADVARDLDRLRGLVGDRKLTYLGFSYGSYLGSTYATLFPGTVRAMVIDGVLDPRLWSSGKQIKVDARASRATWEEFLRLCDLAEEKCAFWSPDGAEKRWERLTDAVREKPVTLDEFTYTYDLLIADAVSAMYAPEMWPDYAAFLDLVADAALGDEQAAKRAAGVRSAVLAALTADEADYPNGFEAYYGNQCADTEYPSSFTTFSRVADWARSVSEFGPYWWWQNAPCANWPTAPDRYAGPWMTRTSAPVLVVGNRFDVATGYEGAVGTSWLLRGSRLLSYAGWGHTAYGRNTCVASYVDDYLVTGTLPRRGTVCPANPNPFLEPAPSRRTQALPLIGLPAPWQPRG
jgi:pimeloyl-ACP methyl ester carboxylesterase